MRQLNKSSTEALIYSVTLFGHRESYVSTLSNIVNGKGGVWEPDVLAISRIILTKTPVIFVTLDDAPRTYIFCCLVRALFGKRTIGLLIGYPRGATYASRIFIMTMEWVNRLKGVYTFSILPRVVRKVHGVSNWIYDPCFWDLKVSRNKLSDSVIDSFHQSQRALDEVTKILFIGTIGTRKGFPSFVKIAKEVSSRSKKFIFVAAGMVDTDMDETILVEFRELGGILINRYLQNDEVNYLQSNFDIFWACYSEYFDQSSGIAGRAFQYNKAVIVRKDSVIDKALEYLGFPRISVEVNNSAETAKTILNYSHKSNPDFHSRKKIECFNSSRDKLIAAICGKAIDDL